MVGGEKSGAPEAAEEALLGEAGLGVHDDVAGRFSFMRPSP